jgi:hypothetical protein
VRASLTFCVRSIEVRKLLEIEGKGGGTLSGLLHNLLCFFFGLASVDDRERIYLEEELDTRRVGGSLRSDKSMKIKAKRKD